MAYQNPVPIVSGATWANLQADGLSGVLELLITQQNTSTAAPTVAATGAASGSGHTLPAAADYYFVVTETNGFGETTAGPVSSGVPVTLGQELTVTYQALKSGNIARNLYVGTASTGPFTLAATGVTSATTVLAAPLPSNSYAINPPTVNTTGLTFVDGNGNTINKALELLRGAKDGNFEDCYRYAAQVVREFLSGQPIMGMAVIEKLRKAHIAVAMINQLMIDVGGLLDANAGTLNMESTPIGMWVGDRTWP
jgi:hypothetical protein